MKRILRALWCGLWLFSAQAIPPETAGEEERGGCTNYNFSNTRIPSPHCTCLSKTGTAIVATMGCFLSSICFLSIAFFAVERERDPLLKDIFYGAGGGLGALGIGLGIVSCHMDKKNPRATLYTVRNTASREKE